MIMLTTPPQVKTILGGAGAVAFDKMVLASITYDSINLSVRGSVVVSSTVEPEMSRITGSFEINTATARLTLEIQQLDFYRRVALTGPQNAQVQTLIRNAQNALESGLISLGIVAGVQSTGS